MEYIAESKNIKMTPRKVRLVADAVKRSNGQISSVLSALVLTNKRAATPLKKAIDSAIANAINNFKAKKEDLILKNIIVSEGIVYKRFRYAGRGRTRPYKKKTSHIRVVLEDKMKKEEKIMKKIEVKKEKEEKK
ncbi:MAG: 50S ribosomal protein L22 [Candidatus Levybacteria bacterium CG10_big_fil_rev_8_21_14_0_10_36_7]|nr:MAG: 50S ribosomal protein L22 [Candidatus Levybacteria bacterium CG10_big_fil_rev_8_21_14_0_10_36_7]